VENVFNCTILGNPVAQARPRAVRTAMGVRMHDTEPVSNYKAYARLIIAQNKPVKPFDGALAMSIDVYVTKPKSWAKKRIHADTKPDADNFCKLICDVCEGIVYVNDSRVVDLSVRKHLSDTPRVEIQVEQLN
jgi:Holliday junction resolvase RusA-like endonuclease